MNFNPYESPQDAEPDSRSRSVRTERIVPFASAHTRAQIAMGFLALNLVLAALALLGAFSQSSLIDSLVSSDEAVRPAVVAKAVAHDAWMAQLRGAKLGAYLACAVAFICWLHRAHWKLPALGAGRLEFTPGWAIGGWFVPFLNLVRPYQVVQEVWLASNPKYVGDERASRWRSGSSSMLVRIWWAVYLGMGILGWIGIQFVGAPKDLSALRNATFYLQILHVVMIVSAAVAIGMVWSIDKRQTLAYDALCSKTAALDGTSG